MSEYSHIRLTDGDALRNGLSGDFVAARPARVPWTLAGLARPTPGLRGVACSSLHSATRGRDHSYGVTRRGRDHGDGATRRRTCQPRRHPREPPPHAQPVDRNTVATTHACARACVPVCVCVKRPISDAPNTGTHSSRRSPTHRAKKEGKGKHPKANSGTFQQRGAGAHEPSPHPSLLRPQAVIAPTAPPRGGHVPPWPSPRPPPLPRQLRGT